MKQALLLITLMLTGCAGAPLDQYQQSWIEAFNNAASPDIMERAAEQMERSDYIRYSQQGVKFLADRRIGSYAPTEAEREFVYFFIARYYLQDREDRPTKENVEKSRIYMRKLLECPGLHNMSRYLVARVQELDGVQSATSQVFVPKNMKYWRFGFGLSKQSYRLDDLRVDYEKALSERMDGKLGGAYHALAFASLIGSNSVTFKPELGLSEMNHVITLTVRDQRGARVPLPGLVQN